MIWDQLLRLLLQYTSHIVLLNILRLMSVKSSEVEYFFFSNVLFLVAILSTHQLLTNYLIEQNNSKLSKITNAFLIVKAANYY